MEWNSFWCLYLFVVVVVVYLLFYARAPAPHDDASFIVSFVFLVLFVIVIFRLDVLKFRIQNRNDSISTPESIKERALKLPHIDSKIKIDCVYMIRSCDFFFIHFCKFQYLTSRSQNRYVQIRFVCPRFFWMNLFGCFIDLSLLWCGLNINVRWFETKFKCFFFKWKRPYWCTYVIGSGHKGSQWTWFTFLLYIFSSFFVLCFECQL